MSTNENSKRSLNFVFVGLGGGGSEIAAALCQRGYEGGAINTAETELSGLRHLRPANKLCINVGPGGAGQDPEQGRLAAQTHRSQVKAFLQAITLDADHVMVCVGGGGGTGTGGMIEIIRTIQSLKRPVGVIFTLPRDVEGTIVKVNALKALPEVYALAQSGEVSPLVIVDNNRISDMFPNVSVGQFYPKADQFLADLWHAFNRLSARSSRFSVIDAKDYLRILRAGKCMALGYARVDDLRGPTALSRAMSEAIHGGLLANGFDLSTANAVSAAIVGAPTTIENLPQEFLDAGFRVLQGSVVGAGVFTGVYDARQMRGLRVYTMFGGLDLPLERIQELAAQAQVEWENLAGKMTGQMPEANPFAGLSFMQGPITLERGSGLAPIPTRSNNMADAFAQRSRRK